MKLQILIFFVAVKSNLELKEFDRPIDTKIMPYYAIL
tara:strand:+ start:316 stop:426 length:111 start_codon:yes stop_codon:yes gene_type:complete